MRLTLELLCLEATTMLPAAGAAGPAPPSLHRGSGAAFPVTGPCLPDQCCPRLAHPTWACVFLEGQGRCRVNQPRNWPGGLDHDRLCLRKHAGDGHPLRSWVCGLRARQGVGCWGWTSVPGGHTQQPPQLGGSTATGAGQEALPGAEQQAGPLTLRQAWLRGPGELTGALASGSWGLS